MASINRSTYEDKHLVTVNGVDKTDLADVFYSVFSVWERSDFLYNIPALRESLVF